MERNLVRALEPIIVLRKDVIPAAIREAQRIRAEIDPLAPLLDGAGFDGLAEAMFSASAAIEREIELLEEKPEDEDTEDGKGK